MSQTKMVERLVRLEEKVDNVEKSLDKYFIQLANHMEKEENKFEEIFKELNRVVKNSNQKFKEERELSDEKYASKTVEKVFWIAFGSVITTVIGAIMLWIINGGLK